MVCLMMKKRFLHLVELQVGIVNIIGMLVVRVMCIDSLNFTINDLDINFDIHVTPTASFSISNSARIPLSEQPLKLIKIDGLHYTISWPLCSPGHANRIIDRLLYDVSSGFKEIVQRFIV